jgi:hypothetical protein
MEISTSTLLCKPNGTTLLQVGKCGVFVIETIITIFAIGFLGIALAIGGVCIMVWMALNED